MIISGAGDAARRRPRARVIRAVRSMRGKIAALSAAVRVRARKPYIVETSLPHVAAKPRARAPATKAASRCGPVDRRTLRWRRSPRCPRRASARTRRRRAHLGARRERSPSARCRRPAAPARNASRRAAERRAEAHDADARDVAFEQRVRRLRRRVRDERDRGRVDAALAQQPLRARRRCPAATPSG